MILDVAPTLVLVDAPSAPAAPRPGTVPRTRLLRKLAGDQALALLAAPAGYGKTTLLHAWAARDERPFSWVSLATAGAGDRLLRRLDAAAGPQVIVADDAQDAAPDLVQRAIEAAGRLPRGSTLALASRTRPAGLLGRLRAERLLVELTPGDLRLSRIEAAMLVDAVGVPLDGRQLDRLLDRTGGWPAMVSLAAQALVDAPDLDAAIAAVSGADRDVAEYLEDVALGALPAADRAFLRRTSMLTRLTAPACDAVLGKHGSGTVLARLERAGLPLEPVDRTHLAFRAHPLLSQLLRAELARLEPELQDELHLRAARWYARQGEPGTAIPHAVAGRDPRLAGRIAWAVAPRYAAEGRGELLGEWLAAAPDHADPALTLTAAVHHLLSGRRRAAGAALDAAERALVATPLPEGDAAVALLRACAATSGMKQMASDAARARARLGPDSPWHALALLLAGVVHHLGGERERAREDLEEAAARAVGALPVVCTLAHAQLALLAAEGEAWDEAARHARVGPPPGAPEAVRALASAVAAVVAAHRGEMVQARDAAAEAGRLLAAHGDYPPWLPAEANVWLARAAIRLSDGPTARRRLVQAARLAPAVGGELSSWVHDGWARADALAESATGDGPTLTNAELRILRLLPSHMSFREIGERLHVSTNTVKTQALSVYRKLDVSCRSEAVERGRSAGLIGGS